MKGDLVVRRLRPLDEADIREVATCLSREWGLALGYTPDETLDWCQSVAGTQDQCILIAHRDSAMVGIVMVVDNDLEIETDRTPWLSALYITPGHRGQGIAHHLIDAAQDFVRNAGGTELYLYAAKGRLITFYGELGWQPLETFVQNATDFVIMRKPLG
nr:GNAT family N-acetyltransferase [uncultured Dongia sp.]